LYVCFAGQGDQIGRTFAYYAIVYSGNFYANDRSGRNCWLLFIHGKIYLLIFDKKCTYILGFILGDFFTNSSGHPAFAAITLVQMGMKLSKTECVVGIEAL
jgi:hypothetical protein